MYINLVNKALIAGRNVQEEERVEEQSKRSRFYLERQGTFSGGYPSQSGESFSTSKWLTGSVYAR